MREILFRGKRIDNGEWIYWDRLGRLTDINGKPIRVEINPLALCPYAFYVNELPFIEEEAVEQYTGLTDKNGKKIFEGDIIKGKRLNAMVQIEHRKYLIIFSNGSFCAEWYIGQDNYNNDLHDFFDRKVIGNIHDNPELLEVEK